MNNISNETILLKNNYLPLNGQIFNFSVHSENTTTMIGTLLSNIAYYGYAPSIDCLNIFKYASSNELIKFWEYAEPAFKHVTGDDRPMEQHVVYKNFPAEVLNMDESQYWFNQILMYIGFPNEYFQEETESRPSMLENVSLKVLALPDENTNATIFANLIKNKSRWSDIQQAHAEFLSNAACMPIILDDFEFKENGIHLIKCAIEKPNFNVHISNATDVLRLCAALSDQDISLRGKLKFRNFKRYERKVLLQIINDTKNIIEDFGMRPDLWKQLLSRLHPGDYAIYANVTDAYDKLYNKNYTTFNSVIDPQVKTVKALDALATRPGAFIRRFHHFYELFGSRTIIKCANIIPTLKTYQILKFKSYIKSINDRKTLMYPPKGNWNKVQINNNTKIKIDDRDVSYLMTLMNAELKSRTSVVFPAGILLDPKTFNIKLQTNDQKLAEYGRGTAFDIPNDVNFIRTASYWETTTGRGHNIWYDNGWNFFDDKWKPSIAACCWNSVKVGDGSAVFSGDPTNSKNLKGRACQMIDLYIDKLIKSGVRYAVWNILAYSGKKFNEAVEVLATLQMGAHAQKGKLYEPSRAQMVFPITGNGLTKYIAYIDLIDRKLIYLDADFNGSTQSAAQNAQILSTVMPAYIEYLTSLPSIGDLFEGADTGTTPILYSDENVTIKSEKAYVFKCTNAANQFANITMSELLT